MMKTSEMIELVKKFRETNILVIGDMMLDKYLSGEVDSISPEAPVPIVRVKQQRYMPGGASNVAANIAGLGAQCSVIGIVGEDEAKKILIEDLEKKNIDTSRIITDSNRSTIRKERIIARSQHLLRIDFEEKKALDQDHTEKIISHIRNDEWDIIVLSDYDKGVINSRIVEEARRTGKKIIVDPKPKNTAMYKGCHIITPNEKESEEMNSYLAAKEHDMLRIGNSLLDKLDSNILITQGSKGMTLFEKGSKEVFSIPTKAREVYDITGAGDTVVALLALAIASGSDLRTAAVLANYAAGIVVGKLGTSTLTANELIDKIMSENKVST